jgi:hypothetical protein
VGGINRRTVVQASLGISARPIQKYLKKDTEREREREREREKG